MIIQAPRSGPVTYEEVVELISGAGEGGDAAGSE
jgi:hypothetical protein